MTGAELVPGAELLDEVRSYLARFVAFPSQSALDAVTLWAAHAHLVDSGENTPRLALLSPEPGSGKTRTLEVLELLVPRPMPVLSASPAAVFRSIEAERPTLLMDEVDAVFNRRGSDDGAEDLRALLNAGHRKGATIPRCVGPRHDVVRFPVYAAVALAGLGDLPDTLMSRAVIVRMRRRSPAERVEPFRRRLHATEGTRLADRLAEWAEQVSATVAEAWPVMPAGVEDRPADVWEPLLAIGDAAGGHWPGTARSACTACVAVSASREASLGVKLLSDIAAVFGDADKLATETLLDRLNHLDESPWADLRGRPLDARGLARRLTAYGVRSKTVRVGDATPRGYDRADLYDAWTRYLPSDPPQSTTSATSTTPQVSASPAVADTSRVADPSATAPLSATADRPLSRHVASVADVADSEGTERGHRSVEAGHTSDSGCFPMPGNPVCTVCGRPNLYAAVSIERGICARCIRAEAAS